MISGKNIDLRDVEVEDAEFILSLRLDPELNRHLSHTEASIEKQKDWLRNYKNNKLDRECYFIIQNKKNDPVGTIRIYDIKDNSFCWGSWIVKQEARPYASFESAILLYEHAFFSLNFNQTHFDVRKGNQKVIDFHLRFGAIVTHEDDLNYYFILKKEQYVEKREDFFNVIERISKRYNP